LLRELVEPCAEVHGLPVGVVLIGQRYAEKTIYQAAHAHEQGDRLADSVAGGGWPAGSNSGPRPRNARQ
jgi:hypothetical protein